MDKPANWATNGRQRPPSPKAQRARWAAKEKPVEVPAPREFRPYTPPKSLDATMERIRAWNALPSLYGDMQP